MKTLHLFNSSWRSREGSNNRNDGCSFVGGEGNVHNFTLVWYIIEVGELVEVIRVEKGEID